MKKKIVSSVLCLAMLASMMGTTVLAADYSTSADLTAEALVFDLEVPSSLPISVDTDGKVEVATDAKITNNSGGMVKVTNVSLDTTDSGWEIVDYETDFTKEKVGLTQFGIIINEDEVDTDGSMTLGSEWVSLYANGGTLDIDYEVNIASQASALDLAIATVEFTLDWDSDDSSSTEVIKVLEHEQIVVLNGYLDFMSADDTAMEELIEAYATTTHLIYPSSIEGEVPTGIANILNSAYIALFMEYSIFNNIDTITIPSNYTYIGVNNFAFYPNLKTIYIYAEEDSISGAPWGATNATVVWLGSSD